MSPEIDSVKEAIEFELGEIECLFKLYQKELFELDLEQTPDLLQLTAFASVLHSFYNGIENILLGIAKNIDKKIPSDPNWNKSLLSQMVEKNVARGPVLSEEMKNELKKYLTFRHFFRHSYSFYLEWEDMEKLIKPIHHVWEKFKSEISSFLFSISGGQLDCLARPKDTASIYNL